MYTIGNEGGEDTINKINANFQELSNQGGGVSPYTDTQCKQRFIQEMNKKAALLGMTYTTFGDPAGNQPVLMDWPNYQTTYPELFIVDSANEMAAIDALRLITYASGIRHINDAWNIRQFTLNYKNGNTSKSATINSTVFISGSYQSSIDALLGDYDILGGKTGSFPYSPYNANTLVVIARSKSTGKIYAVVDFSTTTGTSSSNNKFIDTKSILDHVDKNGAAPSFSKGFARIYELPFVTTSLFNRADITPLYSYGADAVSYPASVTKVMTAILLNDYIVDLNQPVTIHESDRQPPTGTNFVAGDVLTLSELLQCMLMESSNTSAHAIARVVGGILLDKDNNPLT